MASDDDDPRAPYKVYEGDECKGNYPTRAEARRAQQRLESEATGSEPPLHHNGQPGTCRYVNRPPHFHLVHESAAFKILN